MQYYMYFNASTSRLKQQELFEEGFKSEDDRYSLELLFSDVVKPKPYVMTAWGEKCELDDFHAEVTPNRDWAITAVLVKVKNSIHSFKLPIKLFKQFDKCYKVEVFSKKMDAYIKSVFDATTKVDQLLRDANGYGGRAFVFSFALQIDNHKIWTSQKCSKLELNDEGEANNISAFTKSIEVATTKNIEFKTS